VLQRVVVCCSLLLVTDAPWDFQHGVACVCLRDRPEKRESACITTVNICACMCVCACVFVWMCVCVCVSEKETERERERKRECVGVYVCECLCVCACVWHLSQQGGYTSE